MTWEDHFKADIAAALGDEWTVARQPIPYPHAGDPKVYLVRREKNGSRKVGATLPFTWCESNVAAALKYALRLKNYAGPECWAYLHFKLARMEKKDKDVRGKRLSQLDLAQMTMPEAIAAMVDAWLEAQEREHLGSADA
jgi:hypothetical protein